MTDTARIYIVAAIGLAGCQAAEEPAEPPCTLNIELMAERMEWPAECCERTEACGIRCRPDKPGCPGGSGVRVSEMRWEPGFFFFDNTSDTGNVVIENLTIHRPEWCPERGGYTWDGEMCHHEAEPQPAHEEKP